MLRYVYLFFLFSLCVGVPEEVIAQQVFKVKYESQAGWRNFEKQHLLF